MSNENDLPLLLTVEEMAALLRTSRQVIYNMISEFKLPGVTRVGRRVLFRRGAVLQWLRENSVPSP
jgi:excisionase family DNA binding protein